MDVPVKDKYTLTLTIISLFTTLSTTRHTYVTALTSSTNTSDAAIRLLRDVIDPFDKRVRPILNQSQPIRVEVTYNLVNLIEIDEINQRIAVNIWVNFSWWDEFRTWNPEDYDGNDAIHPSPSDIWRPMTTLTNSHGERDVFKDTDSPLTVYSTGATRWYAGGVYHFVCQMDPTYFPYDEQVCTAKLMASNRGSEIHFIPTVPYARAQDYVGHGEWELISSELKFILFPVSSDEKLAFINLKFEFKRLPLYYIINVLVPTMSLSFLSLLGFVVPKDSGERSSFAITVLLSLAVYMGSVSGQLPHNSDTFPIIGVYIFSLLCLSMLSVLIITCQLRYVGSPVSQDSNIQGSHQQTNNFPNVISVCPPHSEKLSHTAAIAEKFHGKKAKKNQLLGFINSNQIAPEFGSYNTKVSDNKGSKELGIDSDKNANESNGTANMSSFWKGRPSSSMSRSSRSESLSKRFKALFLDYDDAILMAIFSVVWVVFTLVFLVLISKHTEQ